VELIVAPLVQVDLKVATSLVPGTVPFPPPPAQPFAAAQAVGTVVHQLDATLTFAPSAPTQYKDAALTKDGKIKKQKTIIKKTESCFMFILKFIIKYFYNLLYHKKGY